MIRVRRALVVEMVLKKSKTDTRNYIDIKDLAPNGKKFKYTDEHKDPFTGMMRSDERWKRSLMRKYGDKDRQDGSGK